MGRGKSKWGRYSYNLNDSPKMRQDWKGNSFERFIMQNGFTFTRQTVGSHRIYKNAKGDTISCKKNMNGAICAAYIKKFNLK